MFKFLLVLMISLFFASCKNEPQNNANSIKDTQKSGIQTTQQKEIDPLAPTNVSTTKSDNNIEAVDIFKVTVAEAKDLVANKGYRFIDVRTPKEIERGKIEGAIELNIKTYDFQHKVDKLDRNSKLIIYDSAGKRSALAAKLFSLLGFSNVVEMPGGYSAWTEANKKQNK